MTYGLADLPGDLAPDDPHAGILEVPAHEALVAAFQAGTLPWSGWRHPQHLAVTTWYLRRYTPDRALAELRPAIQAFNKAHGVETTLERGYHETLTRLWLALVAEVVARYPADVPIRTVLAGVMTALGDKSLPFEYYTRERLMSWDARLAWVEPDRRGLPVAPVGPGG